MSPEVRELLTLAWPSFYAVLAMFCGMALGKSIAFRRAAEIARRCGSISIANAILVDAGKNPIEGDR